LLCILMRVAFSIMYTVVCLSLQFLLYTFETLIDWGCQYNTIILTEAMLPKVQE